MICHHFDKHLAFALVYFCFMWSSTLNCTLTAENQVGTEEMLSKRIHKFQYWIATENQMNAHKEIKNCNAVQLSNKTTKQKRDYERHSKPFCGAITTHVQATAYLFIYLFFCVFSLKSYVFFFLRFLLFRIFRDNRFSSAHFEPNIASFRTLTRKKQWSCIEKKK